MLRKPGFPVANCNIKMPDSVMSDGALSEEDSDSQQRRLQLINFGHSQWGFNNWNWAVTKQELDFVDLTNGKYCAGVVAFVSISVKNLDIHRENIGYATSIANTKGFAIYKSRKCAVTNALRETLLSFGGSVATELLAELEHQRADPIDENNQNLANKPSEPKNQPINQPQPLPPQPPQIKKEEIACNMRTVPPAVKNAPVAPVMPPAPVPPAPLPANARTGPRPPQAPHLRPNSNIQDAKLEGMTEEEARAERRRRQRLAQEEFRQKQLLKQGGLDGQPEISKHFSSLDRMLLEIPTQDVVIEETGSSGDKRKSPGPDGSVTKRQASGSGKLDVLLKRD